MRKALILGLALVFVLGMSVGASAWWQGQDWHIETGEYFGNVPYELQFSEGAEIIQRGDDDTAIINQDGLNRAHIGQGIDYQFNPPQTRASSNNMAIIDQDGFLNEGEVNQRGTENSADIEQYGDFNYAGIGQNGHDMTADIYQNAVDSFVRASQFGGEGSVADITQFGDTNRIRTRQNGDFHDVTVVQEEGSFWNYTNVEQIGYGQTADVYQSGEQNANLVEQAGGGNWAKVSQIGEFNEARVDQDGFGLNALIDQDGNGNYGEINQTGGGY